MRYPKLLVLVASLALFSCTIDVDAPVEAPIEIPVDATINISVGPQVCDFVEEFATADDPDWTPSDLNDCSGYAKEQGICRKVCGEHEHCDDDHYCDFDSGTCQGKMPGGECEFDEQCLSDLCACSICADQVRILELLLSNP